MSEPRAWILGVGKTRFGPASRTMPQLAHEAIVGALADSGVSVAEIDALVVANFLGGPNESQLHLNSVVAGLMPGRRIPSWRVEAACASGEPLCTARSSRFRSTSRSWSSAWSDCPAPRER